MNPHAIEQDLTGSLERLRTDRIDVYMLHHDDETVPVGEIVTALAEHRSARRIRASAASKVTG